MIQDNANNSNNNSLNKALNKSTSLPPDYIRVHLTISGKVQGVYFRKHTQDVSLQHYVYGWVKNLPNGNVECVLEGLKSNVDKVIRWCHQGPPNSRVDNVEIKYETFTGNFTNFKVTE
ncbi:MAG TPA: acylphosphatase [Nitrososphaeraceae archaeon]|nr:acylphosphatase [Nitrososphaeraceae archaeon]